MNKLKTMILFAAVVSVSILASCGGSDDDPKSDKEILLEAIQGSWTLDASGSQFANTEIDGSGIGATFSETGFTVTGAVTSYTTGGSYSVTDAGAIADVSVNVVSSTGLEIDGTPTFTINGAQDTITIVFSTKEAGGRVSGLGDWKLVFNKG